MKRYIAKVNGVLTIVKTGQRSNGVWFAINEATHRFVSVASVEVVNDALDKDTVDKITPMEVTDFFCELDRLASEVDRLANVVDRCQMIQLPLDSHKPLPMMAGC